MRCASTAGQSGNSMRRSERSRWRAEADRLTAAARLLIEGRTPPRKGTDKAINTVMGAASWRELGGGEFYALGDEAVAYPWLGQEVAAACFVYL